jgi:hypothetical protein
MTDHTAKIKALTAEELNEAIKLAEDRGAWPLVGALRELKQLRAERAIFMPQPITVAELKHQLEQDRRSKSGA